MGELTVIASVVNNLIDKIADATAYIVKPGVEKQALNDLKLHAINEIENLDLHPYEKYAIASDFKRKVKEYNNCSNIFNKSIEFLKEDAKPDKIDNDWLVYFFDKARLSSDEEIQFLWSKIISEECNNPSTISKTLINTLSLMSKQQALNFVNFCSFCLMAYNEKYVVQPMIYISTNLSSYTESRVTTATLIEFFNFGLVEYSWENEYVFNGEKKKFVYGTKFIEVISKECDENNNHKIKVGNIRFTSDGLKLYKMIDKIYNYEILSFVVRKLQLRHCKVIVNGKEMPSIGD